jgi:hypothetical protein
VLGGEIPCEKHRQVTSFRAVGGDQNNLKHVNNPEWKRSIRLPFGSPETDTGHPMAA